LGNPDKKYEKTPHNAGFLCIDELCRRHDVQLAGLGSLLQYRKTAINGQAVVLAVILLVFSTLIFITTHWTIARYGLPS